ncbi:MAG: dihydroorotate dehydrogenase [Candidatus Fimivivens sp.]
MNKVDLSVSLCGVALKNPIIAASGTYGFGRDFTQFYDISRLGGISAKGVTPQARAGNPPVRIVETPSGILNAVGLQNPGIDAFLATELPWMLEQGTTVICNISGNTIEEFCDMAHSLNNSDVAFIEVNVSCPNLHAGGRVFGSDPESILAVTQAVRRCTDKPIMIKLSPNVSNIAEMAIAAQEGGADAVSLINTLTGMAIDVNTRKPVLGNITGGMSGPAVRPVALRMCYQAAQAVSIPVVGMGGIMTGEDVVMFLLAGCTAVQVGTANLADPMACVRIVDELEDYMNRKGIKRVEELVGALITE